MSRTLWDNAGLWTKCLYFLSVYRLGSQLEIEFWGGGAQVCLTACSMRLFSRFSLCWINCIWLWEWARDNTASSSDGLTQILFQHLIQRKTAHYTIVCAEPATWQALVLQELFTQNGVKRNFWVSFLQPELLGCVTSYWGGHRISKSRE